MLDILQKKHIDNQGAISGRYIKHKVKFASGAEIAIAAQRQIIEELLSFGVSPGLKDGKGKSVSDCATSTWIRNLLSEYAA